MKDKIKAFLGNKWVRFSAVTIIYILWFVVWTGNLWLLLGVALIFDIYITKFISRRVFGWHSRLKHKNKVYREIMSWVEAILFAVIAASLIHIFIFQMYKIPTSSMEKTLLVGDFLCVSKVAYGPRMPITPIALPLVHNAMPFSDGMRKSYSEKIIRPYRRLAGLGNVERNDIVVFNFPAGDTVLLEHINISYYDVLRSYQGEYGEQEGREKLKSRYTVTSRPIDRREHYVKRCVGIPGDTIYIEDAQLYINGLAQQNFPGREYTYRIETTGTPISKTAIERMGLSYEDINNSDNDDLTKTYYYPLTDANLEIVKGMKNVASVEKAVLKSDDLPEEYLLQWGSEIFPNDLRFRWTRDNFGPLWVPQQGATVELTIDNLPLYERIIRNYEGNLLEVTGDVIRINGEVVTSYTFNMDYFFMMGDNRHNSADSRYWGFVPQDHVVGRPAFIWFSKNMDTGKIRWNRIFKSPK